MTRQWLGLLGESGGAGSSSVVARYSRDPDPTIRREAVRAMLAGDDGTVMRRNPQWITDEESSVRYEALVILADHATATQEPLLRRALEDDSTLNVGWALRGLVRLNPKDLDTVLRKLVNHPAARVRTHATIELARRGDAASLKQLVRWLVEWIDKPVRLINRTPFDVLVERQPPGAREALRTAWTRLGKETPANVFGALAAMGDSAALAALRKQAAAGDPLRRASAIDWLGTCRDRASGPKLAEWLVDPEPSVRESATEAHVAITGRAAPALPATAVSAFVPAPQAPPTSIEAPSEPRVRTPVERRPPSSEFPWAVVALLALFGAAGALAHRQRRRR